MNKGRNNCRNEKPDAQQSGNPCNNDFDLDYWRALDQAKREASRDYDRALLTLSSSAIGLSFFLLNDHYKMTQFPAFCGVIAGWISFLICIVSVILSMLLSQIAHQHKLISLCETEDQVKREYLEKKSDRLSGCVSILNWISGTAFFIGLLIFIVVISASL